jgi:hypothetical protein
MYRLTFFLVSLFVFSELFAQQRSCATMELYHRNLAERPWLLAEREELEAFTRDYIEFQKLSGALGDDAVVTIPVVVHVVYRTGGNPDQNISDAQIFSQIKVLNDDFRRNNADSNQTPVVFRPRAADVEIEFCLAAFDPFGNPTTGITRTLTTKSQIGKLPATGQPDVYRSSTGGTDAWDPSKYLNIWVCEIDNPYNTLGYSNLPGGSPSIYDGVVVDYRAFGTVGAVNLPSPGINPYNKGRTTTHELGHFFNLYHPWGTGADNPSCLSNPDLVADTPPTSGPFTGCPSHPRVSCDSTAMFMNFMDYVNDNCMNIFTNGQKTRMLAALNSNARKGLKNAVDCSSTPTTVVSNPFEFVQFELFPNPASAYVNLSLSAPARIKLDIKIMNVLGHEIWQDKMETGNRNWLIDVSGLPAGMYLLEMNHQGQRKNGKFFVFHP